ncbi:MAG: type I methionyl aminopeptidase [Anaeroplasmataceae bacterium]
MKKEVLLKCEELLKKGVYVPLEYMIKEDNDIEGIRKAGIINSMVLDYACENLHSDMTTFELDLLIKDYTYKLGGTPATLLDPDFNHSCCVSINECAAHGVPSTRVLIKDGDLVKIDCTTIVDGYYADACRSVVVGKNEEALDLVSKNKAIMDYVITKIKPYESFIGDIGYYISNKAREYNLDVVVELGGHGVGLDFHEEPFIDSISQKKTGFLITPGMVFTIEPIFTKGSAKVKENAFGIYTLDNSITSQIEYTVAVLDEGVEIITK